MWSLRSLCALDLCKACCDDGQGFNDRSQSPWETAGVVVVLLDSVKDGEGKFDESYDAGDLADDLKTARAW